MTCLDVSLMHIHASACSDVTMPCRGSSCSASASHGCTQAQYERNGKCRHVCERICCPACMHMPARSEARLSSLSVHSLAASAVLLRQCATSLCSSARTARLDFRRSRCSASLRRSSSTCTDQRSLCPVLPPRIPKASAEGSYASEEGSGSPFGTACVRCQMQTIHILNAEAHLMGHVNGRLPVPLLLLLDCLLHSSYLQP